PLAWAQAALEPSAVAKEARRPVRDAERDPVVVGDAEAALAVAQEQLEVGGAPQFVALEAEQVPVVVRRRDDVAEQAGAADDARPAALDRDDLHCLHR